MILFIYAIIENLFWISTSIYLLINGYKIRFLKSQPTIQNEPSLAIIIAVRNEEESLEKALESVCNINYKNYRIIIVNDRSTDGTSAIIEKIILKYPRVHVENIKSLPVGWLGKNHALYKGYLATNEEWMLFTDADIVYNTGSINKAVGYAIANQLDHLAILPEVNSKSAVLDSVLNTFKLMVDLKTKPWKVKDPRSKASIGIGAFNLLTKKAYEKAGTHTCIKMRPDDDLKLGEKVKASGSKQDVLYGNGEVKLQWYKNVKEFVSALMKNTFSVCNYNPAQAIINAIITLLLFALPIPILLLFGTTIERLTTVIIIIFQSAMFLFKPAMKVKWWHVFMIPYSGFLMAFIILKSTYLTIKQGGIYWRDSFYSLAYLKTNK